MRSFNSPCTRSKLTRPDRDALRRGHLRPLLSSVEQREDVSGPNGLSRIERNSLDRSRQIGADRDALHGRHVPIALNVDDHFSAGDHVVTASGGG